MRAYEWRGWRQFDRIIAMSEVDRELIANDVSALMVDIVPNGVDTQHIQMREEGEAPTLVFVGWMRHLPNRDALEWFLATIWPIIRTNHPTVRFRIVGKGLPGPAEGCRGRRQDRVPGLCG